MSEQGKIAASITGLAVVVFVSFVVVPEIKERRAIRTFNESIQAMADQAEADADALRRKRLAAEQASREARWRRQAAKRLGPDERCVSGTVVRKVVVNGVPSFEQVLERQRTVTCAGGYRK